MRDDEKTIMRIRLKRKNKRAIVELLQALGLISVGGATIEVLKRYIEKQSGPEEIK